MDRESMTNEENYCFDVAGYLIVRNVLTEEEVQACNQALDQVGRSDGMLEWPPPFRDPFLELRDHPVLAWYLEQLCGEEYRLDRKPRLIDVEADDTGAPLASGDQPPDRSRFYYHQSNIRFCQGVLALWALADVNPGDGGFVLISASHKSYVEPPAEVLQNADGMGLTAQPVLEAGDLLLCAETALHGVRSWQGKEPQRLLVCGYIGAQARRSSEADPEDEEKPVPDWISELTPVQRAVMDAADHTYPRSVVQADGKTCWLEEEAGTFHPSIYIRDPDSGIDEKEFYLWDLCGHLVLRGVMDAAWLDAANEAIDQCADRIGTGGDAGGDSRRLTGTGLSSLGGLFELPKPYCEPFRKMIAHPAVVQRMNWMIGSGFKFGSARAICYVQGSSGHFLHGGAEPAKPTNNYALQNGRTACQTLNAAWQLRDVSEEDGGFVCVPGSHKARYPMPPGIGSCDEPMGLVQHVKMKAGDVVLFMAAAQTHGAYPWQNERPRRSVLINYRSRNLK